VNLYAYAGNNPISYDDPFGDTVEVGCRAVTGSEGAANHCAVRVHGDGKPDQIGELLKDSAGNNRIAVVDSSEASKYKWSIVAVPNGQTQAQFDAGTRASFNTHSDAEDGQKYSISGLRNSNHFVWEVITGAGGTVPHSALPMTGVTPGLCGGIRGAIAQYIFAGSQCN